MENIFEKIVDIIVAVTIMFIFPLLYFGLRQDTITQNVVYSETTYLVDNVRTQGYLTKDMYDTYLKQIDKTDIIPDIQLEHKELVLEPEYRFKTADEVIEQQNSSWSGSNTYTYLPVTTNISIVVDTANNNGLTMNTETNESILKNAVTTSPNISHVHTDACYAGKGYVVDEQNSCTGILQQVGGYGLPLLNTNYPGNNYFMPFLEFRLYTCNKCDSMIVHAYFSDNAAAWSFPYQWTFEIGPSEYYHISVPTPDGYETSGFYSTPYLGSAIQTIANEIRNKNLVSFRSNDPPFYNYIEAEGYFEDQMADEGYDIIPIQQTPYKDYVKLTNYIYLTGSVSQSDYPRHTLSLTTQTVEGIPSNYSVPHFKLKPSNPICNEIITSIVPTHSIQAVYKGEPLITTATVYYLDGSSKVVLCTSDFDVNVLGNNQTATLHFIGKNTATTSKIYSCIVKVSVLPKTKVCVNGHTYNLNGDGSDPGCIYCNSWLSSIYILNPSSGEITIFKGTTLETNGVTLRAVYLNGRTEILYNGYAHNLDSNYIGNQTVTISYKGKYTTLKVTIKRNLVQCGNCGRFYELYPDGSDPGCPFCAALIPVFTGNVMKYYKQYYTEDILKEVYEGSGVYYFKPGDYFNIDVSNQSKTLGMRLLSIAIPNISETSIKVSYGGSVRDETK
jgi:hypothetical protein